MYHNAYSEIYAFPIFFQIFRGKIRFMFRGTQQCFVLWSCFVLRLFIVDSLVDAYAEEWTWPGKYLKGENTPGRDRFACQYKNGWKSIKGVFVLHHTHCQWLRTEFTQFKWNVCWVLNLGKYEITSCRYYRVLIMALLTLFNLKYYICSRSSRFVLFCSYENNPILFCITFFDVNTKNTFAIFRGPPFILGSHF